MKSSRIVGALFAMTLVFGGANAVAADDTVDLTFQITPIEVPLTQQQRLTLNLFMDHQDAAEIGKLPKATRAQFPLYIAAHVNELDPSSVYRFRRSQMVDAGMSFNDIMLLQSVMQKIQTGKVLPQDQVDFLNNFIAGALRKKPEIALDSFLYPLFGYVRGNPNLFSAKNTKTLNDALLTSVGMNSSEISRLNTLSISKEPPNLSSNDVKTLRRFILAVQLEGPDFMSPSSVLTIQSIVQRNADLFQSQDLYILHAVVQSSPAIQKHIEDNRRASEINNRRAQEGMGQREQQQFFQGQSYQQQQPQMPMQQQRRPNMPMEQQPESRFQGYQ